MPYFITDEHPDCENWAVVKDDGELLGCHPNEVSAIEQMVAVSLAEDIVPGGTYKGDTFSPFEPTSNRAAPGELSVNDFVEWDSSGGMARGQIVAIERDGQIDVPDSSFTINGTPDDPAALIRLWRLEEDDDGMSEWDDTDILVGHRFSTLTKIASLSNRSGGVAEQRQVDLSPPAYMRAAARRGLQYFEEGYAGDGLRDATVREARAMAQGNVTADKWVRLRAWIARHLVDLDAPAANPDNEDYPSAGVVAHLLWGSGPSKRAAQRAFDYADGVVARLEEENDGRARGESLSKMETRVNSVDFEIRETQDGMFFEGYAAVFDSPSEPLPFIERIAPGAFIRSLKSRNDVKILWNHDSGSVLGSTRAGTLKLTEDARGLRVEASLPNTTVGRDAAELLKRGDIDSMSFGFSVPRGGDDWSADGSERTLREVRLHEVSIVAFPAYSGTAGSTSVRGLDAVAQRASVDADSLADAILKIEQGEDITADDRTLLSQVIDKLSPEDLPESDDSGYDMLALKKKKLALLMGL
jgi:HK97 family phage prohead protease